jgi:hypothetical protein
MAANPRCSPGADLARVWGANNNWSPCDPAELLMKQPLKIAFDCR